MICVEVDALSPSRFTNTLMLRQIENPFCAVLDNIENNRAGSAESLSPVAIGPGTGSNWALDSHRRRRERGAGVLDATPVSRSTGAG